MCKINVHDCSSANSSKERKFTHNDSPDSEKPLFYAGFDVRIEKLDKSKIMIRVYAEDDRKAHGRYARKRKSRLL